MCKDMGDTVLKVANGVVVGIEVTRPVPVPVEVAVSLQRIVAMYRDEKLDTVFVGSDHQIINAVQYSIVPRGRSRDPLEAGEVVDRCSFHSS